jgi:hypothetical protein
MIQCTNIIRRNRVAPASNQVENSAEAADAGVNTIAASTGTADAGIESVDANAEPVNASIAGAGIGTDEMELD